MVKSKDLFKMFLMCILSCLLVYGNAATVIAAVDNDAYGITPLYTNISYNTANIIISGIKAECKATVKANKTVNLTIKMELQKEKSGKYETIKIWTSNKQGTYLAMSESKNINVFSNYRLKVTFIAGTETEVVYKY